MTVIGALASTGALAQAVDSPPVVLDPPAESPTATSFRATGFDPAAPRALVLWRFDGETYHRLASGRSAPDGRVDFGLQPLPLVRADFGVSESDSMPEARAFRRFERAVPPPVIAADDTEGETLHVLTASATGELRISDRDSGRLLARIPVGAAARHGTQIELARVLPRIRPRAIALEHVLDDGRRSAPEIWLLEEEASDGP